eukprot:2406352-Karenia_brevis.AAC.1
MKVPMQDSTCAGDASIVEDEIVDAYTRDLSIEDYWYRETEDYKVSRIGKDTESMSSVERTEGCITESKRLKIGDCARNGK